MPGKGQAAEAHLSLISKASSEEADGQPDVIGILGLLPEHLSSAIPVQLVLLLCKACLDLAFVRLDARAVLLNISLPVPKREAQQNR